LLNALPHKILTKSNVKSEVIHPLLRRFFMETISSQVNWHILSALAEVYFVMDLFLQADSLSKLFQLCDKCGTRTLTIIVSDIKQADELQELGVTMIHIWDETLRDGEQTPE